MELLAAGTPRMHPENVEQVRMGQWRVRARARKHESVREVTWPKWRTNRAIVNPEDAVLFPGEAKGLARTQFMTEEMAGSGGCGIVGLSPRELLPSILSRS